MKLTRCFGHDFGEGWRTNRFRPRPSLRTDTVAEEIRPRGAPEERHMETPLRPEPAPPARRRGQNALGSAAAGLGRSFLRQGHLPGRGAGSGDAGVRPREPEPKEPGGDLAGPKLTRCAKVSPGASTSPAAPPNSAVPSPRELGARSRGAARTSCGG